MQKDEINNPKIPVEQQELKALVFDSQYDSYRGVVSYVKIFQGEIKKGDTLTFLHSKKKIEALDVGYFSPKYVSDKKIENGTIGYVVTGLKTIRDAKVGDTLWKPADIEGPKMKAEEAKPIEGFGEAKPFIFAGIYPMDSSEYPQLKDSMEKLILNDSALSIESSVSQALGHGYRCGFLGLLHLDIVKERLFREFDMDVIMTSPQVTYRIKLYGDKSSEYGRFSPEVCTQTASTSPSTLNSFSQREKEAAGKKFSLKEKTDKEKNSLATLLPLGEGAGGGGRGGQVYTYAYISNPEDLPNREKYISIEEPISKVEIITPSSYIGALMQLAQERRGKFLNQSFIDSDRVMLVYELPMNELIGDFYDEIKSLSSGYASMNYEFLKYQEGDLVKLDILIADEVVEALSIICHREQAAYLGGRMVSKLKETIPRALFAIKIQAAIGAKVVARETLSALRKDVTAKLYGGDVSRKRKLLEKQKKGKKKMKQFGKVSLPSEAFVNLLKK